MILMMIIMEIIMVVNSMVIVSMVIATARHNTTGHVGQKNTQAKKANDNSHSVSPLASLNQ
jgi:5-bromo-4-chloroindolyl phosphate hydrolysis protein